MRGTAVNTKRLERREKKRRYKGEDREEERRKERNKMDYCEREPMVGNRMKYKTGGSVIKDGGEKKERERWKARHEEGSLFKGVIGKRRIE